MKRIEITYNSYLNEVAKLHERLAKAEKAYEKKLAKAKKFGVDTMTDQEHREWMSTLETVDGWLVNKADKDKNGAWFDLLLATDRVEEIKCKIERAERRLQEAEEKVEEHRNQIERLADLRQKEELIKLEFEQEQKEWAKDGITLDGRYYGTTPKGKRFGILRNHGFSERSLHCFTLYIDRETIFTSGEFWLAYATIKAR